MYRKQYRFENGYGASVISGESTYGGDEGLFEIAVLGLDGQITYETPITSDVIGWLDHAEVHAVLERIKALPAAK